MPKSAGGFARNGQTLSNYWLGTAPSHVLGIVSCALLFLMMLVTFIDVGGRYLFASPLPAAYELISLIMPGIIFCALPFVCHNESHVTIDLLDFLVSPKARRWQGFLVSLFSTLAMGFVAYRLYVRHIDHRRFGEVTDELFLPLWPFSLAMSILCAVATMALLVNTYAYMMNRMAKGDEHEVLST